VPKKGTTDRGSPAIKRKQACRIIRKDPFMKRRRKRAKHQGLREKGGYITKKYALRDLLFYPWGGKTFPWRKGGGTVGKKEKIAQCEKAIFRGERGKPCGESLGLLLYKDRTE